MSLEFAKKQGFKLKRIERPIYVRNVNGSFNKEEPIEHTVEVNIYYQGYKERIEINVIGGQKQSVILGIPWLAYHNLEIDQKTGEVKMMRCPEKCRKQQRPKQGKLGWQKQREEKKKKKVEKKRKEKAEKQERQRKERTVDVKRVAEEWETWEEEEEMAKSEVEAKKLVLEKFHKWIKVFGKKQSE